MRINRKWYVYIYTYILYFAVYTTYIPFRRRIALHITNTLLHYIRKRIAFMLFLACSILLFYFSPLCVTGYREFPLDDKALGDAGLWGSRIPWVPFRGAHTNCITRPFADNLWPWQDSSPLSNRETATIRFSSLRREFVKDGPHRSVQTLATSAITLLVNYYFLSNIHLFLLLRSNINLFTDFNKYLQVLSLSTSNY